MAIVGRSVPNVPIVGRGSLVDDPVLTTPLPVVVAAPARARPAVVITGRSSLVDVVIAADPTPGPLVVAPRGRARAGSVIVVRAALADDPVLTTPAAIVLAQPTRQQPATVQLLRSSLEDAAAAPAEATPQPIAVVRQPKPRAGVATLIRGALADAVTPAPIVVTTPGRRAAPNLVLLRGALADAPVLTTPSPIVVAAQRPRPPGRVTLSATPLEGVEPTECIVHRPFTGTVGRGATGTVTRPYTGIVEHCSCCT